MSEELCPPAVEKQTHGFLYWCEKHNRAMAVCQYNARIDSLETSLAAARSEVEAVKKERDSWEDGCRDWKSRYEQISSATPDSPEVVEALEYAEDFAAASSVSPSPDPEWNEAEKFLGVLARALRALIVRSGELEKSYRGEALLAWRDRAIAAEKLVPMLGARAEAAEARVKELESTSAGIYQLQVGHLRAKLAEASHHANALLISRADDPKLWDEAVEFFAALSRLARTPSAPEKI